MIISLSGMRTPIETFKKARCFSCLAVVWASSSGRIWEGECGVLYVNLFAMEGVTQLWYLSVELSQGSQCSCRVRSAPVGWSSHASGEFFWLYRRIFKVWGINVTFWGMNVKEELNVVHPRMFSSCKFRIIGTWTPFFAAVNSSPPHFQWCAFLFWYLIVIGEPHL